MLNTNEEIEKIKNELIKIYKSLKEKIYEKAPFKTNNMENIKQDYSNLNVFKLIENINSSIEILINIKLKEENNEKGIKISNFDEDYESLLRREEAWIRKHIGIENQLKLDYNLLLEKYRECEKDNKILVHQIVIILFIFFMKN